VAVAEAQQDNPVEQKEWFKAFTEQSGQPQTSSKETSTPWKLLKITVKKLYYAICDFGQHLKERDENNLSVVPGIRKNLLPLMEKLVNHYKKFDKEKQEEDLLRQPLCNCPMDINASLANQQPPVLVEDESGPNSKKHHQGA
jgi:hypothetical protein